jgi:hypothetical protein
MMKNHGKSPKDLAICWIIIEKVHAKSHSNCPP